MSEKRKSFLLGALVGSVVGSVAALLLAPKSGRELRQDIKEGAHQVTEKTTNVIKQVGEQTSSWVEAAKDKVNNIREWRQNRRQEDDETFAQIASSQEEEKEETREFEEVLK
ncbi:YtxH domain-containing protein [Paenibacillus guangzhouensis]|uniref:YtxH domain-containing protein n=1 Tax=Paenibacillus guangzhouensis TaxID=1473112 RepID=UPI00126771C7|nr:YtxH domain-containing protein [Paenibacillus guangzhouensis]